MEEIIFYFTVLFLTIFFIIKLAINIMNRIAFHCPTKIPFRGAIVPLSLSLPFLRPPSRSGLGMGALGSGCFEDDLEGGAGWEEEKENEASEAERALSIEEAVEALLQGLGEDHEREGLRRTPHRVAEAFRGGTRGLRSLYCRSAVTPLVLLFCSFCVLYDLSVLFRFFSLAQA